MVLQNYVILQEGRPARMHFAAVEKVVKTITDPTTGHPKAVNTLVWTVDELNGRAVVAYYSITSQTHAQDFAPFLDGEKYRQYDFVVTVLGSGFQRRYQVQPLPRAVKPA